MNEYLIPSNSRHTKWNWIRNIMNYVERFRKWNFIRSNWENLCTKNLKEILDSEVGEILFEKYLGIESSEYYNYALKKWRGYLFCKELKKYPNRILLKESRDELCSYEVSLENEINMMEAVARYEESGNKDEMSDFIEKLLKEFLFHLSKTPFYDELSFDLTFNREKMELVLGEIYDEIQHLPNGTRYIHLMSLP